jgi:hydroxymethylbilane synthase
VTAERQFLLGLGGGCAVPVAAFGSVISDQSPVIRLMGLVASIDGRQVINVTGEGADPLELGNQLAQEAIAKGASAILQLTTEN